MSDDSAPDYPPRVIRITWPIGEPLIVDYEGTFDDWEVRAALNEALDCMGDTENVELDP